MLFLRHIPRPSRHAGTWWKLLSFVVAVALLVPISVIGWKYIQAVPPQDIQMQAETAGEWQIVLSFEGLPGQEVGIQSHWFRFFPIGQSLLVNMAIDQLSPPLGGDLSSTVKAIDLQSDNWVVMADKTPDVATFFSDNWTDPGSVAFIIGSPDNRNLFVYGETGAKATVKLMKSAEDTGILYSGIFSNEMPNLVGLTIGPEESPQEAPYVGYVGLAHSPVQMAFSVSATRVAAYGFSGTYSVEGPSQVLNPTDQVHLAGDELHLMFDGNKLWVDGSARNLKSGNTSVLPSRWDSRPSWIDEFLIGIAVASFALGLTTIVKRKRHHRT